MLLDFDKKLTAEEQKKLDKRLESWTEFFANTVVDPPEAEELEKLLMAEVVGRKRLYVAQRLLGMYQRAARRENSRIVAKAVGAK